MGLFDLFKSADKKTGKPNAAAKWAERIEKRVQNYDRQEAITALSEMCTPEAVEALLKRFTFHMEPSITDQEEKDAAFRGILRAGPVALVPVRAFAAKAESLAWPMKIAHELLEGPAYVEEILRWLSRWDTEYAKFVDPKVQLITALEEQRHPAIRAAVERFLEDVNEPARFHAVSTLIAQEDEAAAPALARILADEESVRVRTRAAEGLAAHGWTVPAELREAVAAALPAALTLDPATGQVSARR